MKFWKKEPEPFSPHWKTEAEKIAFDRGCRYSAELYRDAKLTLAEGVSIAVEKGRVVLTSSASVVRLTMPDEAEDILAAWLRAAWWEIEAKRAEAEKEDHEV